MTHWNRPVCLSPYRSLLTESPSERNERGRTPTYLFYMGGRRRRLCGNGFTKSNPFQILRRHCCCSQDMEWNLIPSHSHSLSAATTHHSIHIVQNSSSSNTAHPRSISKAIDKVWWDSPSIESVMRIITFAKNLPFYLVRSTTRSLPYLSFANTTTRRDSHPVVLFLLLVCNFSSRVLNLEWFIHSSS